MEIFLAVSPDTEYVEELSLLKCAVLYGDRTEFLSLNSGVLTTLANLFLQLPDEAISILLEEFLLGAVKMLVEKNQDSLEKLNSATKELALYREIRKKGDLSHSELLIKEKYGKIFPLKINREVIHKELDKLEIRSISRLISSGVIKLSSIQEIKADVWKYILEKINTRTNFPILDSGFATGINNLQGFGNNRRTIEAGIAFSFLEKLPNLESASLDEIVDIRKELQKPLDNFRGKIIEYSREITANPWDNNFKIIADDLFREKVVPSINQIDDEFNSNKLVHQIMLRSEKLAAPLIGAGIATTGAIFDIGIMSMLGVGISAAKIPEASIEAYNAYIAYKKEQKKIEGNSLYFYYDVSKRLRK